MRRAALPALPALALLLLAAGCARGPARARRGDRVRVEYAAYVDDKLFESSEPGKPVELTIGAGQLPAAAEQALIGLRPGERSDVRVRDAYGPYDPKKLQDVPVSAFSPAMAKQLAVGKVVLGTRGNEAVEAVVRKLGKSQVQLDFNHRLAGKTVAFRFLLVSLEK